MNRMLIGTARMGFAFLLGVAGCASRESAVPPIVGDTAASEGVTATVSDASSDSLTACLARVSRDSSDGARMVAEQSCRGNDALHQSVAGTAIAKSGNRASAGTQGDSLEACLARIPAGATVGQRLLAEETCKRDQMAHH